MRIAPLGLAAVALAPVACTAAHAPATPMAQAVSGLRPLHSGQLDLKLTWSAGAPGESRATAGFGVQGPFADPRTKDGLPVFSLTATRIGSSEQMSTVISDGSRAVSRSGATVTPLTDAQVSGLRGKPGEDLTGLRALGVAGWSTGPQGTATDPATGDVTVTSQADPVAAINAIVGLADRAGASTATMQTITPAQASAVRSVLASSELTLTTGRADHLLHRLHLTLTFAPSSQSVLRSAAGEAANVVMTFDVSVAAPDQPVAVSLPPA